MNAAELLAECDARNIEVQARGGRLEVDGPRGVLTPELLDSLRTCKPDLLAILAGSPGVDSPRGADDPQNEHGGTGKDLEPQGQTATAAAGWILPDWPPVVPPEIIADPIPTCSDCGRRVVEGHHGTAAGLCWNCWLQRSTAGGN